MSSSSSSASGGIGFAGLLTVVFVTLKLLEVTVVANWSWWWVLAPMWIPIGLVLAVMAIIGLIVFIVAMCKK